MSLYTSFNVKTHRHGRVLALEKKYFMTEIPGLSQTLVLSREH